MTPKQQKFCLEYVASGNATEAAIKAGYSKKTARSIGAENLTKPYIKTYIAELTEQIESAKIADAVEIQQILTSIIRKEAEEEVVVVEGAGDGFSEATKINKRPSHKDVISAANTLCKMKGLFDTGPGVNVFIPVFSGEAELEE